MRSAKEVVEMRVRVLGQLSVTADDGTSLGAGELPRRARQVLAVLAARYDRIQSKDALADAVWGTNLPGNHVAALEHYVSVIRRRLQPKGTAQTWFIVTRSGGYLFDTGRASLDLADLRGRVRGLDSLATDGPERLARYEEILELARELPFPEDPYADWAETARSEVQVAAVNALLRLADDALSRDPARALRLAQEAIELDPFLEPGYHAAMSAAIALGRPDDALRLFERCRRSLDGELGVQPSAELVRLQRAVLASRHGGPPAEAAGPAVKAPAPAVVAKAPATVSPGRRSAVPQERFLGRITQLSMLFEPDPPPVVHVVGPNGAGKTAFLAEVGRNAPGRVGVGHGASSVGALRLSWLRTALIELGAPADVLAVVDAAEQDRQLCRDQLELIATAFAGPEPVFLAVDDAGDLDAASVAELAWLGRHCPALRILLTYTYPSQLTGRPVAGLGTPVVLRLHPLTAAELAPLGDDTVFERTGGIPALVSAVHRPYEIALSVAMQVARLRTRWMAEPAWEVLRLCAALGPLRALDLALLTGHSMAEVLACIDRLVHAHLLSEEPGGQVWHSSTLIRDAVAEQVSSASSLHLREQLAAAS
jgi:DNA-binding SARP family transcriptional activator